MTEQPEGVRLQKVLANAGVASRRVCEEYIVAGRVREAGLEIENVDATVLAQAPKLAPHILQMRGNIAAALCVDPGQVSVKATTEEGLGFTGRGEGIAAQAVALLR